MRLALERAKLFIVGEELDPDLGITQFISEWTRRHASYPTFLIPRIRGFSRFKIVMNLLKRSILLDTLNVPRDTCLEVLARRFVGAASNVTSGASLAVERIDSMSSLPVMRHQPGDVGRYLTSAIGCLRNVENGVLNLGFYRVLVKDGRRCVIFMDPRTDAFRIVENERRRGHREIPITLFIGASLPVYFAAAFNIPYDRDSYEAASCLAANTLVLDNGPGGYPPAPASAEIVVHGRVLDELETEAPFGEFKGYYCNATRSPVLMVDEIFCRHDPYYLGLFCGKESGLTLMALQNEVVMFERLCSLGFEVDDVSYSLDAFGEFFTAIQSPNPSNELLQAALAVDRRTKAVILAQDIHRLLSELSIFDFHVVTLPYEKRGERRGDRMGVIASRTGEYRWVEY